MVYYATTLAFILNMHYACQWVKIEQEKLFTQCHSWHNHESCCALINMSEHVRGLNLIEIV